jgi:hypothetical protein
MAKILKNTTGSSILVTDTGITIPASPGSYTIPAQDYLLWAASDNTVTYVGAGDLVVNDGSYDLSISDGIDLIKGLFPSQLGVLSGNDLTPIGHDSDKLLVKDPSVLAVLVSIAAGLGVSVSSILKQNEVAVGAKTENDISGTTHTVTTGKTFMLNSMIASYDAQATIHVRLKKQVGGAGAFSTLFRITLEVGGQGQSTVPLTFGNGILIGQAGDVFKLTVESSIANKGTIWACYTGTEI